MLKILFPILVLSLIASRSGAVLFSGGGLPTITALSLSNSSFTGGATTGTVVGNITATASDGSAPTLTLSTPAAGLVGSGYDANSFQIVGGSPITLQTNTSGGTDQPGNYNICINATGAYGNTPQQICPTISATGPGGAGWQMTFSDEFNLPKGTGGGYMLNWQNQYTVTSYSWASVRCAGLVSGAATGCGTITTSAAVSGVSSDCVSRIGACTISVVGATNTGSGGNSVVNGAFVVVGVSGNTLNLYMPYSGIGTIGLGTGTVLGSGPWVTSIVASTSTPHSNPTMEFTNNLAEGWDAADLGLDSNGLSIVIKNASFVSPDGVSHTYTSGHIQTWNGNAGFAQSRGNGMAMDFYGMPATGGSASGILNSYWSIGNDNSWPGTGSGGGELDIAEFGAYSCSQSLYDMNTYGAGGTQGLLSPTGTFIGVNHQFTATNIGGAVTWYLDGSSINTASGWQPTDPLSPIVDSEYSSACGAGATLPLTMRTRYVRVYSRVTSGACYTSIPSSGTIPHIGSC